MALATERLGYYGGVQGVIVCRDHYQDVKTDRYHGYGVGAGGSTQSPGATIGDGLTFITYSAYAYDQLPELNKQKPEHDKT